MLPRAGDLMYPLNDTITDYDLVTIFSLDDCQTLPRRVFEWPDRAKWYNNKCPACLTRFTPAADFYQDHTDYICLGCGFKWIKRETSYKPIRW